MCVLGRYRIDLKARQSNPKPDAVFGFVNPFMVTIPAASPQNASVCFMMIPAPFHAILARKGPELNRDKTAMAATEL